MVISATENRIEHSGDGATVAFSFPYRFLADADLDVYIRASDATETLQTITTHYTVSGAGDASGGTVTFVTAPGATDDVVIVNIPAQTQGTDYVSSDPFPAQTHEDALDRLTLISQAISDRVDRSVQLTAAAADPSSPITIDLSETSKVVAINSAGDGLQYLSTITAASGSIPITGTPSDGQVLQYSSSESAYQPANVSLADGDYGDISVSSGTFTIDPAAVTAAKLADGDYGDFSISSGVITIDTGAVTAAKIGAGAVTAAKVDEATAANWRAATADKIMVADTIWDAAAEVTLTDAATVAVDLSSGLNFTVTLGGNRTMGNPSNTKVGQTGWLRVVQDGTGSRTLSWASNYEFAGGTAPTLSTGAADEDLFIYLVISSTRIFVSTAGLDIS